MSELSDSEACQSRPSIELEHEIMNPCIPKNEREWWAAREIERLHELTKELSDALISIRPLGGSEMFRLAGHRFYADPRYCKQLIEDTRNRLHEARMEAARLRLALDPPAVKGMEQLDTWIEREFGGYGRAIRARDDPPYPGEPYMSMEDAKELTRRAVATFASLRTMADYVARNDRK